MKRIGKLMALMAGLVLMANTAYADDVNVSYSELPQDAKAFITKHFGQNAKVQEVEYEQMEDVYTVELRNGYDIKFDKAGKVVEVDSPDMKDIEVAIVKDVLPAKAVDFLSKKKLLDDVDDIKVLRRGGFIVETDKMMQERDFRFSSDGSLIKGKR